MKFRLFLIVLALASLGITQTSLRCTVSSGDTVTIGQSYVICLHFKFVDSNAVTTIKSYAFPSSADEFSVFQVSGMKQQINKYSSVTIEAQFQNRNDSTIMTVWNATGKYYRAVFSIVTNVQGGGCRGISADNQNCDWCSYNGYTCVDDQCYRSGQKYGGPDPKFYITWIGTDSDSNHFLSQAKRLSRFNQYSVGSVFQQAQNFS